MIDEHILIDAFTDGINDPALDLVTANFMTRPEFVGYFYAVANCGGDSIKKMPKTLKISEVNTRDNHSDDGHQGDGGGKRRGDRVGVIWTGQGGGGKNHGEEPIRKEIDYCTHIKDQYVSNTVYKDYSTAERAKLYELRLDRLQKEGPQGDRKKYVQKIKSLQRQIDESQMGNDDPSDDEANLYDSYHVLFEGYELYTKDKNNRVRQGGPWKRIKIKK